ncbi:MAG: restriction endonuclease [Candidatus Methanosuratincola petrocarbonis]
MAIPDFQTIMLPVLKAFQDGREHSMIEILDHICSEFKLTEDEKKELLPSGTQPVIHNRVSWAITYLKKAGLLEAVSRGHYRITDDGQRVLENNPPKIDVKFLKQFPIFLKFQQKSREDNGLEEGPVRDPRETLEKAYETLKNELVNELLAEIRKASPKFLEKMVVELLLKMGYGGSRMDAGKAIGKVGDEGIDGIIKEDKLGLDAVYLQAKRWDNDVGRPEIQKFVGALKGQRANKGIFITTSSFTQDARDYVSKIDSPKVVLIDGKDLAELMIEHDVGVSREACYEIKKLDSDFFSEQ